ncbi:MAG: GTPase Era [Bdellovibrionales bacterium]|jgi:GTP-binding protein Era|nr:GTPase Era [Bdellovibrionales bacterium]
MSSGYKAGFVALLGEPNAGKSTLMNAILGEKISIVSEKPQTTRVRIHGIHSDENSQIVFVDAPGTIESTSGINSFLKEEVSDVVVRADAILVVLAADTLDKTAIRLLEVARNSKKPYAIVVTKGDLLVGERAPKSLPTLMASQEPFVVISAKAREKEARSEVLQRLRPLLPDAPGPLYDEEMLTTETMRKLAAEFVREACFQHTRQEIPYGLAVRIVKFEEPQIEGEITKIYAEIVVDRPAHKAIVIGAKASNLKKIGTDARASIERLMGEKIYLDLHVDVREGWTKNKRILKELGYVIVKE